MKWNNFFVDKWKASFVFKLPGGSPSYLVLLKHMVVALNKWNKSPLHFYSNWQPDYMDCATFEWVFQRQRIKVCSYFPNIPSTKVTKGLTKLTCLRSQATKIFSLKFVFCIFNEFFTCQIIIWWHWCQVINNVITQRHQNTMVTCFQICLTCSLCSFANYNIYFQANASTLLFSFYAEW